MSGLGNRLVNMMRGREIRQPPMTFREKAEELRRTAGVTKGARIAGVDRRTFQRWFEKWNAGMDPKPRKHSLDKLDFGVRRAWVATAPADGAVVLNVKDRNDPARATRTITAKQLRLSPGTMTRVADVYVATGDAEAAAAAFLAGVQDRFYRRWLTPPRGDRDAAAWDRSGGSAAVSAGVAAVPGPRHAEGEEEFAEEDLDQVAGPEVPETAYDEFMDAIYDEGVAEVPDDDVYGGDVQ
ncbi:hypothetical protein ACFQZ4_52385 [Catellatospora coxensis]|uniref:Homeodomain-like domain-containing protein n=1 Tax=Catellatospora coxensis TaxID=310354 RepID=A0A8J3PC01_9ACTN|nr:hypothetical protein [Catellatospora coxensis]GIG11477.1 hypothetical protein Cco03nite_81770 [Catellatospora coxensis]